MIKNFFLCVGFLLLGLQIGSVTAQDLADSNAALKNMSEDEITILNAINEERSRQGLFLVAPNAILDAVAEQHLSHLVSRGPNLAQSRLQNGQPVEQWLIQAGYPQYTQQNRNVSDVVALSSSPAGGLRPANLISYWLDHPTEIISYRTSQGEPDLSPLRSRNYREVGIAYRENMSNGRRYFVIIWASQPNILPVVVTQPPNLTRIRDTVTGADVVLSISNEFAYTDGDEGAIGEARFIHVSECQAQLTCPVDVSSIDGWDYYYSEYPYTLSQGLGEHPLYIYFCDTVGRQTTTNVSVVRLEPQPNVSEPEPDPPQLSNGNSVPPPTSVFPPTETALILTEQALDAIATQQALNNTATAISGTMTALQLTNDAPTATPTTQITSPTATLDLSQTEQALNNTATAISGTMIALQLTNDAPTATQPVASPTIPITPPTATLDLSQTEQALNNTATAISGTMTALQLTNDAPTATPTTQITPPTATLDLSQTEQVLNHTATAISGTMTALQLTNDAPTATQPVVIPPTLTATRLPTFTSTPNDITDPLNLNLELSWTADYLLLRNIGSKAIDVNRLQLNGPGESMIMGVRWYEETGIRQLSPDACLVAYVIGNTIQDDVQAQITTEDCEDTNSVFIAIAAPNAVWAIAGHGDFYVAYDGNQQVCTPTQSMCVFTAVFTEPTATPTTVLPFVEAVWDSNHHLLALVNRSESELDFSGTTLTSGQAVLNLDMYLNTHLSRTVPKNECILLYLYDADEENQEVPLPPAGVTCSNVYSSAAVSAPLTIWEHRPSFSISIQDTVETCQANTTTCRIYLH